MFKENISSESNSKIEKENNAKFLTKKKKRKIVLLLLLIFVLGGLATAGWFFYKKEKKNVLPPQEIGERTVNFINNILLKGRLKVSLVNVEKDSVDKGLYKVTVSLGGTNLTSYVTLDGKYFYPERFNIEENLASNQNNSDNNSTNNKKNSKESCQAIKKLDTPLLQAFVVSNCPFGLQMQRILSEINKKIPSLIKDVKVRYLGEIVNGKITSMHGDKEAQENLRQICIREEQGDKYWDYVSCYIQKGESSNCLQKVGINLSQLDECMSDANRGLKYAKEDFSLEKKYGITGSPTLILNGNKESEFNFGGRSAEAVKELLCCGFSQEPGVCDQQLTTAQADIGFSKDYSSGSSGSGGCGN